jgi:hypothetical protein
VRKKSAERLTKETEDEREESVHEKTRCKVITAGI